MDRRTARAAVLGALFALAVVAPAAAKEGALAELDAGIPRDAEPGSQLEVGWRAWTPDGSTEHPLMGSPLFIRLTSADGSERVEVSGREDPAGSGHYLATVTIPQGGVSLVEIGLRGESCANGSCSRSDMILELPDEQRLPGLAAAGSASSSMAPSALGPGFLAAAALGLLGIALATLAVRARRAPRGLPLGGGAGLRRG